MGLANAGEACQSFSKKIPIGCHVSDTRFEQVIEAASDHIAFADLWDAFECAGKSVKDIWACAVESDLNEDDEAEIEHLRVQACHIALNDAALFEFADAFECRGGA